MSEQNLNRLLKNDRYQVFLFTCPATLPFSFSCHPWFVVNRRGVVSRWEVFWRPQEWEARWGHLHKDFYTPLQGIAKFLFTEKYLWGEVTLLGGIEGEENSLAARMAECIENSPHTYPYCYTYSLPGPNSNTYVQWVLDQFPESGMQLPWNAFGKHAASSKYY